jgi:hypothetical protein
MAENIVLESRKNSMKQENIKIQKIISPQEDFYISMATNLSRIFLYLDFDFERFNILVLAFYLYSYLKSWTKISAYYIS